MEKIAVIGEKGSGKTSLLRAFFRLVEFDSGIVKIDNVDISQLEPRQLRSHLSIIPHDQVIFSGFLLDLFFLIFFFYFLFFSLSNFQK